MTVNWPLVDGRILRMTANLGATPFLVDSGAKSDFDSLTTIYLSPDARRHKSGVELGGWGVFWGSLAVESGSSQSREDIGYM